MQIQRINCCPVTNGKKQNFQGFTERAMGKICGSNFSTAQILTLDTISKKGALIDYDCKKGCFGILGKNNQIDSRYTAPLNYEKLAELVKRSKNYLLETFGK